MSELLRRIELSASEKSLREAATTKATSTLQELLNSFYNEDGVEPRSILTDTDSALLHEFLGLMARRNMPGADQLIILGGQLSYFDGVTKRHETPSKGYAIGQREKTFDFDHNQHGINDRKIYICEDGRLREGKGSAVKHITVGNLLTDTFTTGYWYRSGTIYTDLGGVKGYGDVAKHDFRPAELMDTLIEIGAKAINGK